MSTTTLDVHRWPTRLRAIALGGLAGVVVGLLFAAAIATFMSEDSTRWSTLSLQQMVFWGAWGALLLPLSELTSRVEHGEWWRRAGGLLLVAALAWLMHSAILYVGSLAWTPGLSLTAVGYVGYALRSLYIESITVAAALGAIVAWQQRRRARDDARRAELLAHQLTHARLRTLESQLHPHFLFNALHSISMLAHAQQTDRIVQAIARLADLLRAMLDAGDEAETSVRDELALVERYLDIERLRFDERLDASIDVDEETLMARVPRFLVQPLLENAMRHGLGPKVGRGAVAVHARREQDTLVITVSDDGVGLARARVDPSRGFGLRVTRERLAGLYGDHASLRLEPRESGGTVATVRLPWTTVVASREAHPLVGRA